MYAPAPSRVSLPAILVGLLGMAAGIAGALEALAHHPGSHAYREADGRVRVEVASPVGDACTTVGRVEAGAPTGVAAPAGAVPVTVRLQRPPGAPCATVVRTATGEAVLAVGREARTLHLYVIAPDGRVAATERVPIR
ncbi:MAG TPA: hypothetical protein VM434_11950 [Beijerinckiaceae bacterium]|nr:hypothetical protein [Beijerinckiaceae bacterium]